MSKKIDNTPMAYVRSRRLRSLPYVTPATRIPTTIKSKSESVDSLSLLHSIKLYAAQVRLSLKRQKYSILQIPETCVVILKQRLAVQEQDLISVNPEGRRFLVRFAPWRQTMPKWYRNFQTCYERGTTVTIVVVLARDKKLIVGMRKPS
jgi:hypothetical protein